MNIYVNKKERKALNDATEQVRNVLEGCTAEPNSWVVGMLNDTLEGLNSLCSKVK